MIKKMCSLAQYYKDNKDQDFKYFQESLNENYEDNQLQINSNQLIHFGLLNQINNPYALNIEKKKFLFGQQEQQENKNYENQIDELNKLQNNHSNEEKP